MIVRKLLVYCIIPLFLTYQWQQLMQSYYFTRQDFPKRDKLQHDLSLFSEGGFYYSFYEQFALADSWGEAFQLLFRDKISEYPDTINALVSGRESEPEKRWWWGGVSMKFQISFFFLKKKIQTRETKIERGVVWL